MGDGWEVHFGVQSVYGGKAVCEKELLPSGGEEEPVRREVLVKGYPMRRGSLWGRVAREEGELVLRRKG